MATVFDITQRHSANSHRGPSPEQSPAFCAPPMDLYKQPVPDLSSKLPNGTSTVVNGESVDWIVQKFGGTSVGKFALNIVDQVIRYFLTPQTSAIVARGTPTPPTFN